MKEKELENNNFAGWIIFTRLRNVSACTLSFPTTIFKIYELLSRALSTNVRSTSVLQSSLITTFSRTQVVPLDWWPVSRDCLAYGVTVAILICIIHDERVEWYEALTLVLLYIVYIAVMYWDKSFQRCTRFRTNDDQISSDGRRVTTGETVISVSLGSKPTFVQRDYRLAIYTQRPATLLTVERARYLRLHSV